MKIRTSFVSNSSSASFIIKKCNLTEEQIDYIKNHGEHAIYFGVDYDGDRWSIHETKDEIKGYTSMTNFCIGDFLDAIGVKRKYIKWDNGDGEPYSRWKYETHS